MCVWKMVGHFCNFQDFFAVQCSQCSQTIGNCRWPTIICNAGRGWTSYQIFKKGVLDRTSIFRGGCLERGGWSFLGAGCNFHIKNKNFSHAKNKLKSENLMIKKVYIQKCFSLFFFSLCFCFYNSVTFKR